MSSLRADDAGPARYADGLITLPDGTARGVETVVRLEVRAVPEGFERAGAVVGSVRQALGTATELSLPLRLAVSTMRAGLGVIEEGLRPRDRSLVEIGFADGAAITAVMGPDTVALIRRDAQIARGALDRAAAIPPPRPSSSHEETGAYDPALTSIFRYEKRNGRLRRAAVPGTPDA